MVTGYDIFELFYVLLNRAILHDISFLAFLVDVGARRFGISFCMTRSNLHIQIVPMLLLDGVRSESGGLCEHGLMGLNLRQTLQHELIGTRIMNVWDPHILRDLLVLIGGPPRPLIGLTLHPNILFISKLIQV